MICLIFFAWWYSSRKGSIWDYCLWLSVSRYAHPNILRLIMSAFGWSVGIGTLKIVQNERSINSLGKNHNLILRIWNYRLKFVFVQSDCRIVIISIYDKVSNRCILFCFCFLFLHRYSNQGKITSKTATVGLVWSGVPSHTQTYLHLPGVNFRSNNWLDSKEAKNGFLVYYITFQIIGKYMLLSH